MGDGLPAIPKKLHSHILSWEWVDLAELRPTGSMEKMSAAPDPQRFIVMPGLEVDRVAKKPIGYCNVDAVVCHLCMQQY